MPSQINQAIARVVGESLGEHYYSHRVIEARCYESGFTGDPPEGNCSDKVSQWIMREVQHDPNTTVSKVGNLLQEFMDGPESYRCPHGKEKIIKTLAIYGLGYITGGYVRGAGTTVSSRSLEDMLRQHSIPEIEKEFDRAAKSIEEDPPAAITAACCILESFCRVYLQEVGVTPPSDQTAKNLWNVVAGHIGFAPGQQTDEGMKRVFSGFFSIVDGVSLLRNHDSSAHGREARPYQILPRHARLAVHAAHTLVLFGMETWSAKSTG